MKLITLIILTYSMHFAEVKNHVFFSLVMDHWRLTVKEVIRELFMDRDSEKKPHGDDDSDSSFVPEEENSDSDGDGADRPLCSYLLIFFLYHPHYTQNLLGQGKALLYLLGSNSVNALLLCTYNCWFSSHGELILGDDFAGKLFTGSFDKCQSHLPTRSPRNIIHGDRNT